MASTVKNVEDDSYQGKANRIFSICLILVDDLRRYSIFVVFVQ